MSIEMIGFCQNAIATVWFGGCKKNETDPNKIKYKRIKFRKKSLVERYNDDKRVQFE